MPSIHRPARRGKKQARPAPASSPTLPSPRLAIPPLAPEPATPPPRAPHPYVAATELDVLNREWTARGIAGEMSAAELREAPLALVLLHAIAFEEGPPVRSMLHALRAQMDGLLEAAATGEVCSVDLSLSTLDAWRRRLDVAIELDRRGAR
jgi:hypothetical protein